MFGKQKHIEKFKLANLLWILTFIKLLKLGQLDTLIEHNHKIDPNLFQYVVY